MAIIDRLMSASDLALGLGMVRRTANLIRTLSVEILRPIGPTGFIREQDNPLKPL